jgi:hypothetical protein
MRLVGYLYEDNHDARSLEHKLGRARHRWKENVRMNPDDRPLSRIESRVHSSSAVQLRGC